MLNFHFLQLSNLDHFTMLTIKEIFVHQPVASIARLTVEAKAGFEHKKSVPKQ